MTSRRSAIVFSLCLLQSISIQCAGEAGKALMGGAGSFVDGAVRVAGEHPTLTLAGAGAAAAFVLHRATQPSAAELRRREQLRELGGQVPGLQQGLEAMRLDLGALRKVLVPDNADGRPGELRQLAQPLEFPLHRAWVRTAAQPGAGPDGADIPATEWEQVQLTQQEMDMIGADRQVVRAMALYQGDDFVGYPMPNGEGEFGNVLAGQELRDIHPIETQPVGLIHAVEGLLRAQRAPAEDPEDLAARILATDAARTSQGAMQDAMMERVEQLLGQCAQNMEQGFHHIYGYLGGMNERITNVEAALVPLQTVVLRRIQESEQRQRIEGVVFGGTGGGNPFANMGHDPLAAADDGGQGDAPVEPVLAAAVPVAAVPAADDGGQGDAPVAK